MTDKELKEFLEECENNMEVVLEYHGFGIKLEKGDILKINDCYFTDKRVYLEFK